MHSFSAFICEKYNIFIWECIRTRTRSFGHIFVAVSLSQADWGNSTARRAAKGSLVKPRKQHQAGEHLTGTFFLYRARSHGDGGTDANKVQGNEGEARRAVAEWSIFFGYSILVSNDNHRLFGMHALIVHSSRFHFYFHKGPKRTHSQQNTEEG